MRRWLWMTLVVTACTHGTDEAVCEREFDGVICGDGVDDDCDGVDELCPATRPFTNDGARWACQSTPPPLGVVAYARFDEPNEFFKEGACLVVFEGANEELYIRANSFARSRPGEPACQSKEGCTCPSPVGLPSQDRRLFAFGVHGDCPPVALDVTDGVERIGANTCRRPLIAPFDTTKPHAFLGRGTDTVHERLDHFSTIELACAEFDKLPFASLAQTQIQWIVR